MIRIDRLEVPFSEERLDNGLRLIVHEERSTPVVAVHLMVHVGSKHEPAGRTGFAHLFEHLLFQGSEHVPPGAHFVYVQEAGGSLNGSTWFDRTNYFEVVPVNALELVLWLESDRLGFFLPGLSEEKFETQRGVVMNERRQRYEDQPYGLWFETALELLYPTDHPYRHPTIGSMEDLAAASIDDAREFFRTHYRPNNAALVIAGDVDHERTRDLVERYFGEIPPGPVRCPSPAPTVSLEEERRAMRVEDVELPRVYILWHAPPWSAPGSHALDLAAYVLAGDRSSRLYRDLVYRRRIAQEVRAVNWQPLEESGLFLTIVTGKPEVSGQTLIEAFDEALEELAAEGPTEAEITRAQRQVRLGLARGLAGVRGRADALAHATVLLDDPGYVERQQRLHEDVVADEVRGAVRRHLSGARRAIVEYVPENRG